MSGDPNFPRMMFHASKPPVTVNSQSELEALGPEWGYKPFPAAGPRVSNPVEEPGAEPAKGKPRKRAT